MKSRSRSRLSNNVFPATALLTLLGACLMAGGALADTQDGSHAAAAVAPSPPSGQPGPAVAPAPSSPPAVIRFVSIEGVRAIALQGVIAAAEKAAVGHLGDHETLQAAIRAVNALYRERGYPVEQVVNAEVTAEGILKLQIVEGRIRRIVVRGNKKTRTSTILEALGSRIGDAYNTGDVKDDRNRLARLGLFNDVTVTAQVPGAVDQLPPGLKDLPGFPGSDDETIPTSKSNKDDTKGAGSAPADKPSETPATNAPGEPDKTVAPPPPPAAGAAAAGTAAPAADPLPAAAAEPLPTGEDRVGEVDLVVRVEERQTANIAATIGYADVVGAVGFVDLSEINVAGTGQRVAAEWQRATSSYVDANGNLQRGDTREAASFSYEHPALGLRSTAYSVDVYNQNTVFLPYFTGADFTIRTFEKRDGATVKVGHSLSRKLTGYLTARHDVVGYDFDALETTYADNSDTTPLPPANFILDAGGTIGALGTVIVADGRDAADNPHRGFLSSLTFEDSTRLLGGNRLFQQTTVDLRGYAPLTPSKTGPVLATRLLTGYSTGDVPLPEMYFLGGNDLLRGYQLYSIFGDRMIMGTEELRAPISDGVQGVAFVDAGNAWLPGDRFGDGGVKLGVGIGLRFLSPIGPLRFDAAYGDQLRTYVSLGQSF